MKSGKIWGTTELILNNSFIEMHRIYIKPHSFCSLHKHEFKFNYFYVLKGKLFIETHKNDYDLIDVTELNEGDYCTILPNEYHKFFTKNEAVEAFEVYYLNPINTSDIVRKDVGGSNTIPDNSLSIYDLSKLIKK